MRSRRNVVASDHFGTGISSLNQSEMRDLQYGAERFAPPVLAEESLDSRLRKDLGKRQHILAASRSRRVYLHAPLQDTSELLDRWHLWNLHPRVEEGQEPHRIIAFVEIVGMGRHDDGRIQFCQPPYAFAEEPPHDLLTT